jgi:hypothetical protein
MNSNTIRSICRWISKDKIPIGAMEIYFMETCLYSKKINNTWPSASKMALKCREAYQCWKDDKDFTHLRHLKPSEIMRANNFSMAQMATIGSDDYRPNMNISSHPVI